MSLEQIPAKEFMRRMASIDKSLDDIAKSLRTLVKITNRQYPIMKIDYKSDPAMDGFMDQEDEENEM